MESIVERQIEKGRREGYFDDLPGAGMPISDLGQQRPDGWWAARVVEQERAPLKLEETAEATDPSR